MSRLLLTTEYDPDYVIAAADGSPVDLCDGSFIVTYQDGLLALACNREQKLGLHLVAANAGVPTTLLEHPTLAMFTRAVREGESRGGSQALSRLNTIYRGKKHGHCGITVHFIRCRKDCNGRWRRKDVQ